MQKVLKRLLLKLPVIESKSLNNSQFIYKINQIFEQYDTDRKMLERSLKLSSDELNEINLQLKIELNDKKSYQQQLETILAEKKTIINSIPEAILNFSSKGVLKQVNSVGYDFLNLNKSELSSLTAYRSLSIILKKIAEQDKFIKTIKKIRKDNKLEIKGNFTSVDNEYYEFYSVPGIYEGEYTSRVWCFKNITNIRNNEHRLHHQAFHDQLTGLPNRALVKNSIENEISFIQQPGEQVVIMLLDLDDFKKINDTLGHQQGDLFLINISQRIKSTLSDRDILGRMSGDEFLIVLPGITVPEQIIKLHDQISALFKQPFQICGHQYFVSCSIGVSSFPRDGDNAEVLIGKADMAMYQAKKEGKSRIHYFNSLLEVQAIERVNVENSLRHAIKNDLFIFHYQPKIDLLSNKLLGVEALIRMQLPNGELMYPDDFICIAEESGLIGDITKIVIKKSCEKLKEWKTTHLSDVSIAINVTALDFSQSNFVQELLKQIEDEGVDKKLLQLEITESVLMDDIKNVMLVINELKKQSITVAIDDFGTGYSSFSYLHDFDVDYIKIDKSFIQGVKKSEKSKAIVKSIIDLGINLNIKVIAEGVESINDHNFLCKNKCHIGQGYFYNKPLTGAQIMNLSRV